MGRFSKSVETVAARSVSASALVAALLCSDMASAQVQAAASDKDAAQSDQMIIVTGTRREGVTAIESARPVDIISADVLTRQGASNLNDALRNAVPSLNVQQFVAQDGSAFIRPFSLRGLPPDQTLVLLNNKRRHRSALVQITNQPLAAGAQGPDLSSIPTIAIKSIEVLRDGAAAQDGRTSARRNAGSPLPARV
jgi:iron complex outermembrane receptor protein